MATNGTSSDGSLIYLGDRSKKPRERKVGDQQPPSQNHTGNAAYARNSERPSSHKCSRVRSGLVPPRPDILTRRTPTPTKQVSLQVVKRIDDRVQDEDVREEELDSIRDSITRENSVVFDTKVPETRSNESMPSTSAAAAAASCSKDDSEKIPEDVAQKTDDKEKAADSDSDSDEEETRKAPTELLMEFITCLMEKDYQNASKLCKMILIYEPDNAEARKFQPLIEEKIELDQIPDYEESEDEEGEGSDEDEDEDDSSSNDDDDDDDDDDSGHSVNEDEFAEMFREDSGVASGADD